MAHLVSVHRDIGSLAHEWEALADRVGADPFSRPGWFVAHHDAFGQGEPEVLAVRDDGGRLVAVAALERSRLLLASAANWHTPFYAPLAETAAAREAVTAAMVARARPRLSVGFIIEGSRELDALRSAAGAAGCRTRTVELERCPYVELAGGWEDYERRLNAKRRANLRRLQSRIEERGRLQVTVHDGSEDLDRLVSEGLDVEASGWKGEQGSGTAIRSEPAAARFYPQVARWLAERGWLRLAFLRLDGRALAFDFAAEAQGVHYLLKTGYLDSERSAAPGVLLRREMLRRSFQMGLDRYEFLGDLVDWKREWTDHVHPLVALEVFSPFPAGRVAWLTWAYARPAVRRLQAALR